MSMKELAETIRTTVQKSQDEEEFPDYLAVEVLDIADKIEDYSSIPEMLLKLIFMVSDYNTYAETCCEKIGTSHLDIENYLKKIDNAL